MQPNNSRVDLRMDLGINQNRPMSFRLLFRSLHFVALVFATIILVCFGVQEKRVGKNSCFGVPLFRGLVMPASAIHKKSERLVSELMNAITRIDSIYFEGQKKNTWHFFSLVCFSFGHPLEYVT